MAEEKEKLEEKECINCSWNGKELSKSCKTLGNINDEGQHKVNKEGLQKCTGCGYLDNKCPVCGDEVGKPGIRKEIEDARLAKEEAERKAIEAGLKAGAIF